MGLVCEFDLVEDIFGMAETPKLGIEIDYSEACDAFVETFLEEAYDRVPVDTGALMGSIDAYTDGYSYVRVEASEDYAQYVEFGTYKMEAQPYFVPACQKAWRVMKSVGRDAIDEALDEEAAEIEAMEEEAEEEMEGIDIGGGFGGGGASLGEMFQAAAAMVAVAFVVGLVVGFLDLISYDDSDSFQKGVSLKGIFGDMADSDSHVEHFIYID